jgi:predicted enzyme related to lactoylglutathione lyase
MNEFFQVVLRTNDVDAARAFYARVLGERALNIVQLHEQAVARGARPHWLGLLQVADVEQAAAAFIARGATSLGPKWINPEGLEASVLRDPGGALMAVARPHTPALPERLAGASGADLIWCSLNTADVARACANYAELFSWQFKEPLDLGALGVIHPFAYEAGGEPAGSMIDIAGRPGVHPHWLFHFRVAALEPAVEAVRALAGKVLPLVTLPSGERIAVCDDPQGAAFALRERS